MLSKGGFPHAKAIQSHSSSYLFSYPQSHTQDDLYAFAYALLSFSCSPVPEDLLCICPNQKKIGLLSIDRMVLAALYNSVTVLVCAADPGKGRAARGRAKKRQSRAKKQNRNYLLVFAKQRKAHHRCEVCQVRFEVYRCVRACVHT